MLRKIKVLQGKSLDGHHFLPMINERLSPLIGLLRKFKASFDGVLTPSSESTTPEQSKHRLVLQGMGLDGQVLYPTQKYSFQIEDSACRILLKQGGVLNLPGE
ncbi:MAG: hypothetical protein PQJ46_02595 [Spirochaetales bacterium]|nr:hypothetical protein [Spirochaetales bacterium]